MSYPFGNGNTVTEFHAEQAQTRGNQGLRRSKRDAAGNGPHANKRAALGTITNQRRSQPVRAAKQGAFSENFSSFGAENAAAGKSAFAIPQQSQGFSIFVDEDASTQPQTFGNQFSTTDHLSSQKLQLRPELTSLLPSAPLSDLAPENISIIDLDSSNSESPMVLDVSLSERNVHKSKSDQETREQIILTVPEYADDIYRYLREAELRNRAKAGYMRKQPDITNNMRSILVDWLVEVAEEYKLHRETLFLAVNYIDRFLSLMSVLRGKLQLVGAASMFLAAKYEEIYPPDVGEFVYITDDTYTKKQVLRMEHLILKVLSFDVAVPTVNCFIEKFIKQDGAEDNVESLAMYLAELTLVDADQYLRFLPSTIAASCVCLANYTLNKPAWSQALYHQTGYQMRDFGECLLAIHNTMRAAPAQPQQAIVEKYKTSKFHNVSSSPIPACLPDFLTFA